MSKIKTNKITWIVALAICTPIIWLGIQSLVAQDSDPFGEGNSSTQGTGTVEDPFGESPLPSTTSDSNPNTILTPNSSTQVPDDSDPFGEGSGTVNPVDDPSLTTGGDLPSNSTPFGNASPTDKDPFGTVDSMPNDSVPNKAAESSIIDDANRAQNTFGAGQFEAEFWRYLSANNYKNWAPAPQQTADFYSGKSPHGIYLKMYLNRTAVASPEELPNGSAVSYTHLTLPTKA